MTEGKLSPWKNNIDFIRSLKPEIDFASRNHPKEPNYLEAKSWAAFPGIDGFQNLSPDHPPPLGDKEIDVFLFIQQVFLKNNGIHPLIRHQLHMKELVAI